MRRVHLLLGGTAAAVASLLLLLRTQQPVQDEMATRPTAQTPSMEVGMQVASSTSPQLAPPRMAESGAPQEARLTQAVAVDPCASVMAALDAERSARQTAEETIAGLRQQLAEATRKLSALEFPEDTPFGAFLASKEAEEIRTSLYLYETLLQRSRTDDDSYLHRALAERFPGDREGATDYLFRGIKAWLDEFPVMLRPGEATWLAERVAEDDWDERRLIGFLGPLRLAAELPPERVVELWVAYKDEGFFSYELVESILGESAFAELRSRYSKEN